MLEENKEVEVFLSHSETCMNILEEIFRLCDIPFDDSLWILRENPSGVFDGYGNGVFTRAAVKNDNGVKIGYWQVVVGLGGHTCTFPLEKHSNPRTLQCVADLTMEW